MMILEEIGTWFSSMFTRVVEVEKVVEVPRKRAYDATSTITVKEYLNKDKCTEIYDYKVKHKLTWTGIAEVFNEKMELHLCANTYRKYTKEVHHVY